MLHSYLTIALRNLGRHRPYTAINAVGLAIGIACCPVIFAFVRDELSFDRFNRRRWTGPRRCSRRAYHA